MDSSKLNIAAFKEPKAFIKLLQLLLTIIAFSLTANFASKSSFKAACTTTSQTISVKYSYPYNLNPQKTLYKTICDKKQEGDLIYGNYQSQSQFFVFVGVITMLYCIGAIIMYVFFDDAFYQDERIAKVDFIVTAVIAALWFISSVAWADGLSKLKMYTDVTLLMERATFCITNKSNCTAVATGSYGGITASLVGGFGNLLLWLGNLWFVYKDTPWYSRARPGTDEQIIGSESIDGGNM